VNKIDKNISSITKKSGTDAADAVARRDAMRGETATIRAFIDQTRRYAGVRTWRIDLPARHLESDVPGETEPLDAWIHPADQEDFFRNASRLTRERPGMALDIRIRSEGRGWHPCRFRGTATRFTVEGRPALLLGVTTESPNARCQEYPLPKAGSLIRELLRDTFVIMYRLDFLGKMFAYKSAAFDTFGFDDEISTFDDLVQSNAGMLHPDERAGACAVVAGMLKTQADVPITRQFLYRRRNRQGKYRWLYDSLTCIPDGHGAVAALIGTAIDITNMKKREFELRAAEEKYRRLHLLSRDVFWSSGLDMRFNYVSPSIVDLLGYTPEETIALGPEMTLLPDSYRVVGELIHRFGEQERERRERESPGTSLEGGLLRPEDPVEPDPTFCFELWQRHKSGQSILTEVVASVIRDEAGNLVGFCGATRDITENHRMKEALKKSRDELEQAVLERTSELATANEHLQQEIERRRQVEAALFEMSEAEQRSIGHDLHDGLCQQLAGIMCLCQAARDRLLEIGSIDAIQMGRIQDLLAAALKYARYMARGLSPLFTDDHSLRASLETLAVTSSAMFRVSCRFLPAHGGRINDPGQALNLYRIAREAVLGAVLDRKARVIEIRLRSSSRKVLLAIRDNGKEPAGSRMADDVLGMIPYRAESMEGVVRMRSDGGRGTLIRCLAPLAVRKEASLAVTE